VYGTAQDVVPGVPHPARAAATRQADRRHLHLNIYELFNYPHEGNLNYTANNFSTQPQNESNVEINSDKSQVNQVQKSKSRTNEHKPKYTKSMEVMIRKNVWAVLGSELLGVLML
jgi:hypothetical protein